MKLTFIFNFVPGLWVRYKAYVYDVTAANQQRTTESIIYWKEQLFTNFITYLLPFCLLAAITGVYVLVDEEVYILAAVDISAATGIAFVALKKNINLLFRKAAIFVLTYAVSLALMMYMGLLGPGLIYLLALSVLAMLLLPRKLAYSSIATNLLVAILCFVLDHFGLLQIMTIGDYPLAVWIAIVFNLIFLCLVVISLIDQTIHHFEYAIGLKIKVKHQLLLEKAKGLRHILRIKESQEQYKSLFLFSPLPMWVLDPQTLRFLQVNEAAVLEYGYSMDEFLMIKISEVKFEDDMGILKENLQQSIMNGNSFKVTTKHRRKNKEIFDVEVRFNIILFAGKKVSLVVLTDISKEVDYKNAIERQNQQLRDIAWIQSHSVRKPLVNIIALSDIIINNPLNIPDIETLTLLRRSANELDQCIRKISEKAKLS